MLVLLADDGPQVSQLVVRHPMLALGAPLTQRTLRKVAVEHLVRLGIAQVRRAATTVDAERGWYTVEGIDGIWGGRAVREGRGPKISDDRLAQVTEIYMRAVADGRPPVQAVATELPCSRSHAGHLVAQARAADRLAPTSPGQRCRSTGACPHSRSRLTDNERSLHRFDKTKRESRGLAPNSLPCVPLRAPPCQASNRTGWDVWNVSEACRIGAADRLA